MQTTLLLTWATGYIGSHAVVAFEQAGYKTVIIDNLSNSSKDSLDGIEHILWYKPDFFEGDIRDKDFLRSVFSRYAFDGVIHFAGLKAVGESCTLPLHYHDNNIGGSIALFQVMEEYSVRKIVFSSSATVYRADNISPLTEDMPLGTTNPYGTTKLVIEELLEDLARLGTWSVIPLRYFNPIWAHPSGHIGELPNGIPNNLLPYVLDVAIGKRKKVSVYGNDYPTHDGTGVRDYIDVCDLVDAHLAAYKHLALWYTPINIWTGKGSSVLDMISLVEKVTGVTVPYEITARRPWDLATCFSSATRARELLGWKATRTLETSLENGWKFLKNQ